MSQHIVIGPAQRSFARQLLASTEFEALGPDDQRALAALDTRTRRALFDAWEPAGAVADRTFGTLTHLEPLADNALYRFQQALHAKRPDIALQCIHGETETRLIVSRGFVHSYISGFDRHGNANGPVVVEAGPITEAFPKPTRLRRFNVEELVALALPVQGGTGSDFVSNIGKGKWAANAAFPLGTDALVIDLWQNSGSSPETDSALKDRISLNDVTSGTSATTVKATATNYARKVAASITLTIDNSNDWITGDFADIVWTALGGGTNNTIGKLGVAYRPASGSAETAIVPQTFHTFDLTTDGTDVTATVNNWARAA